MNEQKNNAEELIDILGAIEVPTNLVEKQESESIETTDTPSIKTPVAQEETEEAIIYHDTHELEETLQQQAVNSIESQITNVKHKKKEAFSNRFVSVGLFGVKYMITSVFIFGVLLLSTNYSAYLNIVKSYLYEDQIAQVSESLLNSADAGEIIKIEEEEVVHKKTKAERVQELKKQKEAAEIKEDQFSIKKLVANLNKEDVDLDISIVPYENRVIIPKIGKNIPLVDIQETKVESEDQLNNIFMKELEDGVVRYPGSAKPGEVGNSFIFGHSSNFPWIAGEYNDVFSRLGQVEVGDVIFSYYGQKKYKYKITEKKVISPDDTDILKRNEDKKELTLMTCWPIGTTLNRLILIGEIVEE